MSKLIDSQLLLAEVDKWRARVCKTRIGHLVASFSDDVYGMVNDLPDCSDPGWQPIETAPITDEAVTKLYGGDPLCATIILGFVNGDRWTCAECYLVDGKWKTPTNPDVLESYPEFGSWSEMPDATHWMPMPFLRPLPAPPEAKP